MATRTTIDTSTTTTVSQCLTPIYLRYLTRTIMPTISKEEEARVAKAIKALNDKTYPSMAATARGERCDYDILRTRIRGIKENHSRGGHNKRLNATQEASLKLHCERLILSRQNLE